MGTDEVMVGCDPHKRTLPAAVVDGVGVPVDPRDGPRHPVAAAFSNTPAGLEAVVRWLGGLDSPVTRVGVEGSAGWGRHLTMALTRAVYDVREVNARRTADSRRKRRRAKTDREDAFAIARETAADAELPPALPAITDEAGEILPTLVQRRKFPGQAAPADPRRGRGGGVEDGPGSHRAPPVDQVGEDRLNAVRRGALDHASGVDAERLAWLVELIGELDGIAARVKQLEKRLGVLVDASGSTLTDEVGIGPVSAAELLVEVNNPRGSPLSPSSTMVRYRLRSGALRRR